MLMQTDLALTDKLMCEEAVRTGMVFLAESQHTWTCLRWLLRMFRWALTRCQLDHLTASLNSYSTSQDKGETGILDSTFTFDPSMPSQLAESSDLLWESAFLSTTGIPDWQEWLDF